VIKNLENIFLHQCTLYYLAVLLFYNSYMLQYLTGTNGTNKIVSFFFRMTIQLYGKIPSN